MPHAEFATSAMSFHLPLVFHPSKLPAATPRIASANLNHWVDLRTVSGSPSLSIKSMPLIIKTLHAKLCWGGAHPGVVDCIKSNVRTHFIATLLVCYFTPCSFYSWWNQKTAINRSSRPSRLLLYIVPFCMIPQYQLHLRYFMGKMKRYTGGNSMLRGWPGEQGT